MKSYKIRCQNCQKVVEVSSWKMYYCNRDCAYPEIMCANSNCEKLFRIPYSQLEYGRGQHCSFKCRNESKYYRKNLSKVHTGSKLTQSHIDAILNGQAKSSIYPSNLFPKNNIQNKSEILLERIIKSVDNDFSYCGNFKFRVGSKFPDFVNHKKKLLIELFGEYWHKPEEVDLRKEYFLKYGWDCLIIWYSELKFDGVVREKIRSFCSVDSTKLLLHGGGK